MTLRWARELIVACGLMLPFATNTAKCQPVSPDPMTGADARIERIRKGDMTIIVKDAAGRPVPNAAIIVTQTSHEFLFGCAALSLTKHSDALKEAEYQKRFSELFNFATVLTYWQDTEPERGVFKYDLLTAQARRLKTMGIRVKGHPLILAGACPSWAPKDPDETRQLIHSRIADLVHRFEHEIDVWDVVGDVTTAAGAQNGIGAWARKAGSVPLTAEALIWARAANPAALLLYNDYKLDSDYLNLIGGLQRASAPPDVLGLEAHMIGSEWSLQKVWDTAESFARLKRPLHFSEITVLSDDPSADHSRSWPSTPEGERRQADYVEKLYMLLFSHPAVEGIGWWNFVDGDWDRNPGGLLRSDLTPKPAYDRLVALIRHKWMTSAELKSGKNGTATLRGFAGRYRMIVRSGKRQATGEFAVRRGDSNQFVVTLP